MPPVQAAEQFADMAFPAQGIDLSTGYGMQRPTTTVEGTNVRTYEPVGGRARGGMRPGLVQYIPATVNGDALVQHLNLIVDPTTAALLDDDFGMGDGVGGILALNFGFYPYPPYDANFVFDPGFPTYLPFGPLPFDPGLTFGPPSWPDGYVFDPSSPGPESSWSPVWAALGFHTRNPGRLVRKGGSGHRPNKNTRSRRKRTSTGYGIRFGFGSAGAAFAPFTWSLYLNGTLIDSDSVGADVRSERSYTTDQDFVAEPQVPPDTTALIDFDLFLQGQANVLRIDTTHGGVAGGAALVANSFRKTNGVWTQIGPLAQFQPISPDASLPANASITETFDL